MRIGTNPKKLNVKKLIHKPHRVIIPVYIPNLEEEYFKNALEVLKLSLDSLLATTNPEQTNITIINNNSCNEVDNFLEEYFQKSAIDKYVKRTQNRGKVEPILSEALGSYEDFITIADADVLYWPGWLEESMKLFTTFSPGVVMPLPAPNHYAMHNLYCFNRAWLLGKLNWGQVVAKEDLIQFEKSIGVAKSMERFYRKQYYLKKNGVKACLGAGHFVATYDRQLFDFIDRSKKVKYIFQNGLEAEYLDNLSKITGACRLSTVQPYVYHMGNTIPDIALLSRLDKINKSDLVFPVLPKRKYRSVFSQFLDRVLYKMYRIYSKVIIKD